MLRGLLREAVAQVRPIVLRSIEEGRGTVVLGETINRGEGEDEQTGVDEDARTPYLALAAAIQEKLGLRVSLYFEDEEVLVDDPDLCIVVDEYGGTKYITNGHFERGWTVCSVYGRDRKPVAAAFANIFTEEIYLADSDEGVILISPTGEEVPLAQSTKKSLSRHAPIAGYLGDPYLLDWAALMKGLLYGENAPAQGAHLYTDGGERIGALLARADYGGGVFLYAMPREPRNEIDVWLGVLAGMPGLYVGVVEKDGILVPFDTTFDPERRADRVPVFVAAVTEAIAVQAVRYMDLDVIRRVHANP